MRSIKILYISQYFPPEMGAPAARVSELAQLWSTAGQSVTVLTGFPNHPTGVVPRDYRRHFRRIWMRESVDGIDVERTWLIPLPNRKSWERILNYSSFCVSAILRGLFLPVPDVLIATSPQLLVGLSGLIISRLRKIPFVFEVRDLWPESLAAVGVSDRSSVLTRVLRGLASVLYRRSDRIVVVSPAFQSYLVQNYNVPKAKICVITNGVDTDVFRPTIESQRVRAELGLDGKFVVSFIGTMGNAHGLRTILEAARCLLQKHTDLVFLLVGEGAEKHSLEIEAKQAKLTNVLFVVQQPKSRIPSFIGASDVCLVPLKKSEIFKTVIPTKMLEYMSCERPVILGVEGQAQQLVEEARAGLCIAPEDSKDLVAAIEQLYRSPDLCQRLGSNGRRYILERMCREQTAEKYLELMLSLTKSDEQTLPELLETTRVD